MARIPAVIIGGNGSNGLGIARSLGRHGIDIYCVANTRNALMIHSKYCKEFFVIPGIETDQTELKELLRNLEKRLPRTTVIFPTSDEAVLTLSSIRNELNNYESFISNREIVDTLVIKRKFYDSLKKNKIPHPWTLLTEDAALDKIGCDISFPLFIRPSETALFGKIFHTKGFVANSFEDLRNYIRLAEIHNIDVMLQEVIPGPTSNGYTLRGYLDKRSKPLSLHAVRKIRQPYMFSNPCLSVSVPISQVAEFSDTIVRYLESIQYRGLFGAEFKLDPRDGHFKLLEINARSMGGNYIATACGANDILLAYRDLLGEKVAPITHYKSGVYQINLMTDMATLLGGFRIAHKDRLPPTQSKTLRPYFKKKAWTRLSLDDFVPFAVSTQIHLTQLVRRILASVFERGK